MPLSGNDGVNEAGNFETISILYASAVALEKKEFGNVLFWVDASSAEEVVLFWREGDDSAAIEYTFTVVLVGKIADLVCIGIDIAHISDFTLAAQLM